jgi:glycosyltransferase involved in cell wall biosynthesis
MISDSKQSSQGSGVFIMPRNSTAWRGAEALWITAAGWASAAKRLWGNSVVITADRTADPSEVIYYPLGSPVSGSKPSAPKATWLPLFVKTGLKDVLLWRNTRSFRNKSLTEISKEKDIRLVWEQHDLFPGPGRKIATKLRVPFVLYVHAPVVWEASRWNVKRPLWGSLLERFSEARSMRNADIVACVSEEVANKIISLGVKKDKVIISPMSVDPYLFKPVSSAEKLRYELGIGERLVVGWTGSFRSFHGLDILVNVFNKSLAENSSIVLVLVGDGQERTSVEQQVKELGMEKSVIFAGKRQFADIPKIVSLFDIAIVSARSAENFHYSPLKLREYLAAGKATLAPHAGEIAQLFENNKHLMLYQVGDVRDSASKLNALIRDAGLRERLGRQGRDHVLAKGTWDYELKRVLNKLGMDLTLREN